MQRSWEDPYSCFEEKGKKRPHGRTDGLTDGRTDGRTDKQGLNYRTNLQSRWVQLDVRKLTRFLKYNQESICSRNIARNILDRNI